jgi:hypothetical protein
MAIHSNLLPKKIFLEDYKGNYTQFIDAVYEVFERDFIKHRPVFGGFKLGLKYHPAFQERAYTFYHMTHKGDIESERTPDLRRCECMPWGRPTIENVNKYSLKFWEQRRKGKHRICIWLETEDDVDYFFVLDVRKTFLLPWTAFVAEYKNETRKKEREYQEWLASQKGIIYTTDELVRKIMDEMP